MIKGNNLEQYCYDACGVVHFYLDSYFKADFLWSMEDLDQVWVFMAESSLFMEVGEQVQRFSLALPLPLA